MIGFVLGTVGTFALFIFFPVTFQKIVTFVRSFWDKSESTDVK